jgi:HCOMODA/2-hydroxy-3-carboxy-muconic semialdehyde decarboxylase
MDQTLIDDLVAANRILAGHGVIDAYGHVSMRSPHDPKRFFLARNIAPETVQAGDLLEYGLDGWVYGSCGLFGGNIRCHKMGKTAP